MEEKWKQKELVEKIYLVHESLRRQYRQVNGSDNWSDLWERHKGNLEDLKEYSKAMRELATEVWDPRNSTSVSCEHSEASKVQSQQLGKELKCRIEWVYSKCSKYFELGAARKLKLLDIGSCYNPFSKYQNVFDIVAVDLCPAPGCEDRVWQCDFLDVSVGEELKTSEQDGFVRVESLARGHFDVIVMSFLLEYLPDTRQRLEICRKAAELLRVGGILFVIRPDSSPVSEASAGLIKKLKVGMALLGLKRVECDKLTHMWCTAYRKLSGSEFEEFSGSKRFGNDLAKVRGGEHHEMFAIAQDFKSIDLEGSVREFEFDSFNVELADELPFA